MSGRFEDERGVIQDLFSGPVMVTRITTVKGAIRGNHFHEHTTQWTLIISGSLLISNGRTEMVAKPGLLVMSSCGVPHAWKALEDTECLVFTKGPRGEDYESDTTRLEEPLLS